MMTFPVDESSLLSSHHLCKAAIIFAIVRWIVSLILNFIDSDRNRDSFPSSSGSPISAQMIRDSLELTTYADLDMPASACDEPCAVCLNRMEEDDKVRRLRCCHVFHAECIDQWIEHDHENVTCPLCRAALAGPNGLNFGLDESPPSWAVERMLYIFGDKNDLHL